MYTVVMLVLCDCFLYAFSIKGKSRNKHKIYAKIAEIYVEMLLCLFRIIRLLYCKLFLAVRQDSWKLLKMLVVRAARRYVYWFVSF